MISIPHKSLMTALLCLLPGIGLILSGLDYGIGTLSRPGPGLFPVLVGAVLACAGAALAVSGKSDPDDSLQIRLRPYLIYPASLLSFAIAIPRLGLLPAVAIATALATLARPDATIGGAAGLAAAMACIAYVVFVLVLGLPVPAFDWRP